MPDRIHPMNPETDPSAAEQPAAIFRENRPGRREFPLTAIVVSGAVILAVFAAILFFTRGRHQAGANVAQPLDPYAANLPLSDLSMSESTSLSGGKSTFLDGHIRNTGTGTVTGAVAQVFFRNDEGMPPAIATVPIALVRTREPYVDTEPISAEPLKPGDEHDFRLIFETLPPNWNTQLPEIHLIRITTR